MGTLHHDEHISKMIGLAKYLSPPTINNEDWHYADWETRYKAFSEDDIHESIKDGLPSEIQNEVDEKEKYYRSILDEDYIDLLGNIEARDNMGWEYLDK